MKYQGYDVYRNGELQDGEPSAADYETSYHDLDAAIDHALEIGDASVWGVTRSKKVVRVFDVPGQQLV